MPPTLAPAGSATRARARELVAGAWSVPRCEGKRKSASKEAPKMLHLLWVLPLVAGLAARGGGKLEGVAVLVALICGLIGLAYLIMRPRGKRPPWPQQER